MVRVRQTARKSTSAPTFVPTDVSKRSKNPSPRPAGRPSASRPTTSRTTSGPRREFARRSRAPAEDQNLNEEKAERQSRSATEEIGPRLTRMSLRRIPSPPVASTSFSSYKPYNKDAYKENSC